MRAKYYTPPSSRKHLRISLKTSKSYENYKQIGREVTDTNQFAKSILMIPKFLPKMFWKKVEPLGTC